MAISRCHNCGKPTKNVKEEYKASVHPIGYPDTAAICGSNHCYCPGLVWLTAGELAEYRKGRRIFELKTNSVRIKVI